MHILRIKFSDSLYLTGIVLLSICTAILVLSPLDPAGSGDILSPWFIVSFTIATGYFIMLWAAGRLRRGREGLQPLILSLVCFLLSAFLLNRHMHVFQPLTGWFRLVLVTCTLNLLLYNFIEYLPRPLPFIVSFIGGVSFMTFLYLSLYLAPVYPIGILALPVLGLSVVTFIPMLLCIYSVRLNNRLSENKPVMIRGYFAGMATIAIGAVVFLSCWTVASNRLGTTYLHPEVQSELPAWVQVAARTAPGSMSEKILQTGIEYDAPSPGSSILNLRSNENVKHDPLVMFAALLVPPSRIPEAEKEKILRSIHGGSHVFEDRLWSGYGLETDSVRTTVELWPAFRMAYTDLLMNVNIRDDQDRFGQREAIYTFQLPEGAVVSSLSLWIDGIEQKGLLTSQGKADTAYKTIVGVQRRDPSVVHWREGNRVSVRVFPIVHGAGRKFRIGVTSPVKETATGLDYERIEFTGPDPQAASMKTEVFLHSQYPLVDPAGVFAQVQAGQYRAGTGTGTNWQLSMVKEPIATAGFSFDGNHYQLVESPKRYAHFAPGSVCLDLNSNWTREEFDKVLAATAGKPVYTTDANHRLVRLTANNQEALFNDARLLRFSLFPFHQVTDAANTIVIGKPTVISPDLQVLKETDYMRGLRQSLKNQTTKTKYFSLNDTLSPLLRSLQESRHLLVDRGTVAQLTTLIGRSEFVADPETVDRQQFGRGEYVIQRSEKPAATLAPDHLMRLYAYNHILSAVNRAGTDLSTPSDSILREATAANIVTPFSSLIVLETQADYDRFDIKADSNSLGNASIKSKGAVPEPHEWALIILGLGFILYIRFRHRFSFNFKG
ncbi:MAG: XrtN system VIT domain-containing protein [Chitinophagaceae bacterium]|nr:MAG: XrtN system VIT domain-containing protein [Chitinophagaceae bacterium]